MYLLDKFCQVINTFANLQNKFRITIFFAKNLKISNEKRSKRYIINNKSGEHIDVLSANKICYTVVYRIVFTASSMPFS